MARQEDARVALLSIHPNYARGILERRKTVEFRRRTFRSSVTHVVVYATAPVSKVLGIFSVGHLDKASPRALWERHGDNGLIEKRPFFEYFKGAKTGVAIVIGDVHALPKPMALRVLTGRTAGPQSFQYVDPTVLKKAGLDAAL